MTLSRRNRGCRNQHSLAFQMLSASKEAYKSSFFQQTIRNWNDLPDSLISSAQMSDDCVSKFHLVYESQGLISLLVQPPVKYCQFGVSPVNHSDSDLESETWKQSKNYLLFKYLYV